MPVHNSTSWRITKPLRIVAHQVKRAKRVAKLIRPAIDRGGGVKRTVKKAMHIYRSEGLAGIKRGFRAQHSLHSEPRPSIIIRRRTIVPVLDESKGATNLGKRVLSMRGYVDNWGKTEIRGWAADENNRDRIVEVELRINGIQVNVIRADLYRKDLEELGWGNGCRGFLFNPLPYLTAPYNEVEVVFHETGILLTDATTSLINETLLSENGRQELSQRRWKGDEKDAGLTWGVLMSGDNLVDAFEKYHRFENTQTLVEIGPGYGRILKTILERGLPFKSYLGLELSQARTERLSREFGSSAIKFECGDIDSFHFAENADVVICSSTFEHLYPDCTNALRNIRGQCSGNGVLFIDFIYPRGNDGDAVFEFGGGAYVRIYTEFEVRQLFHDSGFSVDRLESISFGTGAQGAEVRRLLVVARPE